MKRNYIFTLHILIISVTTWCQEDSYILKREIFKTGLTSINISPDGKLLLAGFRDGSFSLLDASSFETTLEVDKAHFKSVNAMDMPPKMDYILSAGNSTITMWDLNGEPVKKLTAHKSTVLNLDISSDGKHAVSSDFNKSFVFWDLENDVKALRMKGHEKAANTVCISPDDRWIASGSYDSSVKIWDMESLQEIKTLHGSTQQVYDVAFSPDSRLLAVASKDRSIRIYDIEESSLLHLLKGHRDIVMEVDFSPDGQYLISGSADYSIILWDVEAGERIHSFLENDGEVIDLIFHPGGRSFYSISMAGDLTRWQIHPEIFVLRYFHEAYLAELSEDPLFEPRRKGESKKDFLVRQEEASKKKSSIIDRYYQKYLFERGLKK